MKNTKNGDIIRREIRRKAGYEYKYELTCSLGDRVASYGIPLYSVSIEMKQDGSEGKSENSANNLFSDLGKASVFFDRMVDNLATPIDLPYIVEDEFSK